MRCYPAAIAVLGLAICVGHIRADLYSRHVSSIDIDVDTCDAILVVKIVKSGTDGKAEIESVLKPAGQTDKAAWALEGVKPHLKDLEAGQRLILLAWKKMDLYPREGKKYKVHYDFIPLNDDIARLPDKKTRLERCFYAVDNHEKPYGDCAVLTRRGQVLTEPKEVLDYVAQRIKSPAPWPADRKRDLSAEYGGFEIGVADCPIDDLFETVNHIMVPPDPEYREEALRQLSSKEGNERTNAARRLRNWHDPQVIAALKKCLADDFVSLSGSPLNYGKKFYLVRYVARQSLEAMGVDVPHVELEPK